MSLAAPTPPLLLTKRLTAFLRSNLTLQVHTALLTTLSGKLLAHASPHSVSTLRTQCTVAASLWALYAAPSTAAAVADALPAEIPPASASAASSAVTIQLTGAVVVVRRLRCGLLFVCIGPVAAATLAETEQLAGGPTQPLQAPGPSAAHSQPTPTPTPPLGSPSEAESVASAGAATTTSVATTGSATGAAVVAMRRQAEELARWLDDKLGSLGIPEEGLGGVEGR